MIPISDFTPENKRYKALLERSSEFPGEILSTVESILKNVKENVYLKNTKAVTLLWNGSVPTAIFGLPNHVALSIKNHGVLSVKTILKKKSVDMS